MTGLVKSWASPEAGVILAFAEIEIVVLKADISVPTGTTRFIVFDSSLMVPITSGLNAASSNAIILFSELCSGNGSTSSLSLHEMNVDRRRMSSKLMENFIFFIIGIYFLQTNRFFLPYFFV